MTPTCLLLSYWWFRKPADVDYMVNLINASPHDVRLLIDSGAFSADTKGHTITVTEYADWLRDVMQPRLGQWVTGMFNLDVLRNERDSMRNWMALRERGFDTIPVTHLGDPGSVMDAYIEQGAKYIGLGAMVGRSIKRKVRWAASMHRHAAQRGIRLHGLGVGSQRLVEGLPWYSVDSGGFGSAYRYGRMALYDPQRHDFVRINLSDPRDQRRHGRLLRSTYALDPATLDVRKDREPVVAAALESVRQWQADLQHRKPVRPPTGLTDMGPLVYFVDAANSNLRHALRGHVQAGGSGSQPAKEETLP